MAMLLKVETFTGCVRCDEQQLLWLREARQSRLAFRSTQLASEANDLAFVTADAQELNQPIDRVGVLREDNELAVRFFLVNDLQLAKELLGFRLRVCWAFHREFF